MSCPDLAELEHYVTGDADDASSLTIAQHLTRCRRCGDRLSEISDNLRALAPIRRALTRADTRPLNLPEVEGYRVLRELARGGMGVVYLAQQESPQRLVALKVLRQDFASSASGGSACGGDGWASRLQREAQVLAQLKHPGIAQIYEAGLLRSREEAAAAGRQAFIAMEYIAGRRLDFYVREALPPLRTRLELLARLCDAVHHAHVKGVVHRDLKPGNILVVEEGIEGSRDQGIKRSLPLPKIIDFGVARLTDSEVQVATLCTHTGQLVGTLVYMSPEQLSGDLAGVDARSDVYALGVVAYELLSGRLPHPIQAGALPDVLRAIREQAPVRLGNLDRALHGDIEIIVARALAKEPERRYQSAAEMAADLRRHLCHEPIAARPASLAYQVAKLARRHRAMVATLAASVFALLAATVAVGWQAHVAASQRDAAEERLAQVQGAAQYLLSGIGVRLGHVLGAEALRRDLAETVLAMHARLVAEQGDDLILQARYSTAIRHVIAHSLEVGDTPRAAALGEMLHEWIVRHAPAAWADSGISAEISAGYLLLARVADADGRSADADVWRAAAGARTDPRLSAEQIAQLLNTSPTWTVEQVIANEGAPPDTVRRLGGALWALRRDAAQAFASGDNDAAVQDYRAAIELIDALMQYDPTCDAVEGPPSALRGPLGPAIPLHAGSRSGYQAKKVSALLGLARAERARGARDAEETAHEQALVLARQQLADAPRDPIAIDQLANVESCCAVRLAALPDWDGAKRHLQNAIDRYQLLAEVDPRSGYRARALASALDHMSQICTDSGDPSAAQWAERAAPARAGRARGTRANTLPPPEDGRE